MLALLDLDQTLLLSRRHHDIVLNAPDDSAAITDPRS